MDEQLEDLSSCCWICLGSDANEPLDRPCKCPTLVHPRCLARWQLHCAGKLEERTCRFCSGQYPDWRQVLTPNAFKCQPVVPVLSIYYGGMCTRIRVRPGPDGLSMFCAQLHNILGRDISTVNLVFRCRDPETGAELYLHGIQAWSAAIHCACVRAAKRTARGAGSHHQGDHVHLAAASTAIHAAQSAATTHGAMQHEAHSHYTGSSQSLATVSAPAAFPAPETAHWSGLHSFGVDPEPTWQHTLPEPVSHTHHPSPAPTAVPQQPEGSIASREPLLPGPTTTASEAQAGSLRSCNHTPMLLPDRRPAGATLTTHPGNAPVPTTCPVGAAHSAPSPTAQLARHLQTVLAAGSCPGSNSPALTQYTSSGHSTMEVVDPDSFNSTSSGQDGPVTEGSLQRAPGTRAPHGSSRLGAGVVGAKPGRRAAAIMQQLRGMIRSLVR